MSDYIVVHSIKVAKDFTPETFGRLTTIGPKFLLPVSKQGYKKPFQVCECECGSVSVHRTRALRSGATKSCGCLQKEKLIDRNKANATHGMWGTPEYTAWANMIQRCYNPKCEKYPDYGGRGITVCDRWLCPVNGFLNFLADMGPKPSRKHSIERKEVNDNYCPENCCWATQKEQQRNKRNNRLIEYNGKTQCLAAWAEELGVSARTLRYRIKAGWPLEAALTNTTARKNKLRD